MTTIHIMLQQQEHKELTRKLQHINKDSYHKIEKMQLTRNYNESCCRVPGGRRGCSTSSQWLGCGLCMYNPTVIRFTITST
jgi:hypothetical protein